MTLPGVQDQRGCYDCTESITIKSIKAIPGIQQSYRTFLTIHDQKAPCHSFKHRSKFRFGFIAG
jgi:hypothetical protein